MLDNNGTELVKIYTAKYDNVVSYDHPKENILMLKFIKSIY